MSRLCNATTSLSWGRLANTQCGVGGCTARTSSRPWQSIARNIRSVCGLCDFEGIKVESPPPLVKIAVVVVRVCVSFFQRPSIKRFVHHQHPKLVARIEEGGGWWVVRGTDRVEPSTRCITHASHTARATYIVRVVQRTLYSANEAIHYASSSHTSTCQTNMLSTEGCAVPR